MSPSRVQPRRVTGQSVRQVRPQRRKHHYVRNTFLSLLLLFLLVIVGAFATFLITYAITEIPKPSQFARSQVTTVYYADGKTEIGKFAEVNREIIDTTKLPKYVGNAVVASEDRTFWTNSGVDLKGIIRAFINNARGRSLQGASTLSQQYIERYYMSENTSKGNVFQRYWAKAKEAILALKINRQQDKEEILGNYLNTIYFGRGSYGIQAAAKAYFGKSASDLTVSEAAMLSGIIPAPSAWDPAVSPEMAKKRWLRVLTYMAESGYITPEEKRFAEFPAVRPPSQSKQNFGGLNGYFMFQARQELKDLAGLSEEQIDTQGLKIVTTIDQSKQQLMVDSVAKLPEGHAPNLRVSMVSVDPKNGEIIAEYPGADYMKIQSNAVTQDHFQAGSTFKIFGLIAYLEQGGSINDIYNANSPAIIQGVPIQNFDGYSYGNVTLATATAKSLNVPYALINAKIGPNLTKEVAIRLGLSEKTPGLDAVLTNILGSSSPTALDLATAYATIANEGKREVVHLIRQVTDASGDIVYMPSFTPEQVLDRNVALTATQAMEDVIAPGGTAAIAQIGRPAAAKTGSSSDNKSAVMVGFVPQAVTVVGMYQVGPGGTEEQITPFGGEREVMGANWPAWLWKQYMSRAVKDMEVEQFGKVGKIGRAQVKRSSAPGFTDIPSRPSQAPEAVESPSSPPAENPGNVGGAGSEGGNPAPHETRPGNPGLPGTNPSETGGADGGTGGGGAGSGGTGDGATPPGNPAPGNPPPDNPPPDNPAPDNPAPSNPGGNSGGNPGGNSGGSDTGSTEADITG
ncbi:penicillin-binding protein [Mobiluncus mulieris]|uniref:Penicillin-binding protein n=1 Tax=Mobiluncus mulieris TaxID=2052 RepID=A0A7Y0Y3L8_9ACTO|nr:transglycosylase domain-containing protein [Mobiluncus mulieris]NMW64142.1 penicillin-binding protein [Mobiluncus mulieris]